MPEDSIAEAAAKDHASRSVDDDLVRRFSHHAPPDQATADAHGDVRAGALGLARMIVHLVPDGREQALAITKIEEAMMWANAGIARGGARA
jgi:hypothetical protein